MGQLRCHQVILALLAMGGCARAQTPAAPVIEVRLLDGFGAFEVVNRGAAVSLESAVVVEQQSSGAWKKIPVTNFYLIARCQTGFKQKCVSFAGGATLKPVPWRGWHCYSQCPSSCRVDGPAPPGTYRFVVTTCDGRHRFESKPFAKTQ